MTASSPLPALHTDDGRSFPLHEYHLKLDAHEWVIQHTGVILTDADEREFFRDFLDHLPYGVALWPSSIALAYELGAQADKLKGKTVLELGAGTGLPGIVAATLGAYVTQTDRQELAMELCRRNVAQNQAKNITNQLVDWTDWQDTHRYDWIIGSDILYSDNMHDNLVEIFRANLAPGGRVLLADPFRGVSMYLLESLQSQGWRVTVSRYKLGTETEPRAIGVFELAL